KEESLFLPDLLWLANLTEAQFRESFRVSPVKRTKWRGLVRNACIALGNSGAKPGALAYAEILRTLRRLAQSGEPVIAESARWALSRILETGNRTGARLAEP